MSSTASTSSPPVTAPAVEVQQTPGFFHRRWRAIIATGVPNLIVFLALAAVFYLGHHTGWKMPRLSELWGKKSASVDDWCSEHLVPESTCIECKPELFAKQKEFGFCRKHGVAECVICHPELAQVKGEPQVPRYDTVAAIALTARQENNSRNTLHKRLIQFSSSESADKSGIDVDVVGERAMTDAITANGEVLFDPTRVAHLGSRVAGTVAYVFKTLGDEVYPGDILALIESAQVGQAKSQLLQAIVNLQLQRNAEERLKRAFEKGAATEKSIIAAESGLQQAEIAFISARQALVNLGFDVPDGFEGQDGKQLAEDLRFLGVPTSILKSLPTVTMTANLIPLRATYEGVVVASDVVAGEVVNTTTLLFTVANPGRMLLTLNVRQEDAKHLANGLPVLFRTEDGSQEAAGHVAWVSPVIDERTRTLQVRVKLDTGQERLRDKTFGSGRIVLRHEPNAIVVPREAVQSTSDATFVFVRDRSYLMEGAPKVFHVRQVRIGARDDRFVELLAGVLPGEVIATKGSAVLLAQLLRSSLGAGCGCHDH